jgi:hypothetical protein
MLMSVPPTKLITLPSSEGSSAEPEIAASTPRAKASIKPETSMMRKVDPMKNHGRRLNVSHAKRKAAPAENPMQPA